MACVLCRCTPAEAWRLTLEEISVISEWAARMNGRDDD